MTDFDFTLPVLVAGGGACGAVAALAAAEAGAQVLLIEQDAHPRGTTAMSQGLICAAGTRAQKNYGVDDDADIFFNDIMAKTRGLTDPVIARAIAAGAGQCLDWLIEKYDFPWTLDTAFRAVYGHSRLRVHGWPGHGGDDMIRLLHSRLAAQQIDVLLGARLVNVIDDGAGRALGVEIARPDGAIERIGCDTLILATSGFAANHDLVRRFMPEVGQARHNGHEGNRGEGILLGERLGGALADMGSYQGYGMLTDPQGITLPPGFVIEGGVLVNAQGKRFVNEIDDIAGMVHPVLAQPGGLAWLVYDQRIEQAVAHIPESQQLVELRAGRYAANMTALADIIGCDARRLRRTLQDARDAHTADSVDSLGRSWSADLPPTAPLRALKVTGALYHTQGGLQINAEARVQRADGTTLANVYAGGGAARGVSGPSSWGYLPAMGLCAAVTLGRIAGLSAARHALNGGA